MRCVESINELTDDISTDVIDVGLTQDQIHPVEVATRGIKQGLNPEAFKKQWETEP